MTDLALRLISTLKRGLRVLGPWTTKSSDISEWVEAAEDVLQNEDVQMLEEDHTTKGMIQNPHTFAPRAAAIIQDIINKPPASVPLKKIDSQVQRLEVESQHLVDTPQHQMLMSHVIRWAHDAGRVRSLASAEPQKEADGIASLYAQKPLPATGPELSTTPDRTANGTRDEVSRYFEVSANGYRDSPVMRQNRMDLVDLYMHVDDGSFAEILDEAFELGANAGYMTARDLAPATDAGLRVGVWTIMQKTFDVDWSVKKAVVDEILELASVLGIVRPENPKPKDRTKEPGFPLRFSGAAEGAARPAESEDRLPPIPFQLACPQCRVAHVDKGAWATRPHRTHLCESCGHEWRPFEFATVGVLADGSSLAQSTESEDRAPKEGQAVMEGPLPPTIDELADMWKADRCHDVGQWLSVLDRDNDTIPDGERSGTVVFGACFNLLERFVEAVRTSDEAFLTTLRQRTDLRERALLKRVSATVDA